MRGYEIFAMIRKGQVKRIPANDMGAQRTLIAIIRNCSLVTASNELTAPLLQICNRTEMRNQSKHENRGEKTCETCRYWSELVVRARGTNRSIEAICLNREGPFYSLLCRGDQLCSRWISGHLGAIDDPDLPEGAYASY